MKINKTNLRRLEFVFFLMIIISCVFFSWLIVINKMFFGVSGLLLVMAITFLLNYDYRYRTHWSGYTFGYPLAGFEQQLFFTYDDGPSAYGKVIKGEDDSSDVVDPLIKKAVLDEIPDYDFSKSSTENLLDLLNKNNIKAVFYILGKSVSDHPEPGPVIEKMLEGGHIVGNHSYSHLYSRREPFAQILQDFKKNHDLLSSLANTNLTTFRPPYGDWDSELTKKFLNFDTFKHYTFPMFWTCMFFEWAVKSKTELEQPALNKRLAGLKKLLKDCSGQILLLHDVYITTVLLTSLIIKEAKNHGYTIGDTHSLLAANKEETHAYKAHPFGYYLASFLKRLSGKLLNKPLKHTNYDN